MGYRWRTVSVNLSATDNPYITLWVILCRIVDGFLHRMHENQIVCILTALASNNIVDAVRKCAVREGLVGVAAHYHHPVRGFLSKTLHILLDVEDKTSALAYGVVLRYRHYQFRFLHVGLLISDYFISVDSMPSHNEKPLVRCFFLRSGRGVCLY